MSGIADMLAEFHAVLGDEPGRGGADLRHILHAEEHEELLVELSTEYGYDSEVDRVKLARELADVVYISFGTAHAFDIDLDAALAEVHRAAMSKLDPVCQGCEGERWVLVGPFDLGIDAAEGEEVLCAACGGTGKGERKVRADGKILKPKGFVPPDMSKVVRG